MVQPQLLLWSRKSVGWVVENAHDEEVDVVQGRGEVEDGVIEPEATVKPQEARAHVVAALVGGPAHITLQQVAYTVPRHVEQPSPLTPPLQLRLQFTLNGGKALGTLHGRRIGDGCYRVHPAQPSPSVSRTCHNVTNGNAVRSMWPQLGACS